jgi:uncharacterized membrane protein
MATLPSVIAVEVSSSVPAWIHEAAVIVEIIAVAIIAIGILVALGRFLQQSVVQRVPGDHYHTLKVSLAKTLLLGLEILVAADVIVTVALDATLESVVILGLLVVIRTFLSWSLVVEIEGHWPWQRP